MKQIKIFLVFFGLIGIFLIGAKFFIPDDKNNNSTAVIFDYKNAEYFIDGQWIKLENGFSETSVTPDSATKIVTRYFGNELVTDLNGDSLEDVAFIITQERGGSGIFFYAVAALKSENGYLGSDGYLLGDRIAPQSTTLSQNPRHKNVVVFNYSDRALSEPMTIPPTIGKSVYLKINANDRRWGLVEPNFEGESR